MTIRKIAIGLVACVALATVPVADAALPKKGAFYGAKTVVTGGIGYPGNSHDPTVRIRVAGNGRTLDLMGPHDRCDHSGAGGFNAIEAYYAKIDDVRIRPDGSFQGSTHYVQHRYSTFHHYVFPFDVNVKGRFVTADTAKGKLSWRMTVDGTRNIGGASPCPPLSTSFIAKRGKVVGLAPGAGLGRTHWHPEGQTPTNAAAEQT